MIYYLELDKGYSLLHRSTAEVPRVGDNVFIKMNRTNAENYAEYAVKEVLRDIMNGDVFVICSKQKKDRDATVRIVALLEKRSP